MNESEIRARVVGALGETSYPPALRDQVVARLDRPPSRDRSTLLGFVAAVLAILIVASLVLVRVHSVSRPRPAATPSSAPTAAQSITPRNLLISGSRLPEADLFAAGLSSSVADLVTPLHIDSTSNGRVVTLIGAYADAENVVVFFRTAQHATYPRVTITDDQGFINAGSRIGPGSVGDSFAEVDAGPHIGADGTAHLSVLLNDFTEVIDGPVTTGPWSFSFTLKAGAAAPLILTPPLTSVGSWQFTVQAFEATPSTVRFQAVVNGASMGDFGNLTVSLVDSNGTAAVPIEQGAGPTVPKFGGTPSPGLPVYYLWRTPQAAGGYTLQIVGPDAARYVGNVSPPAFPVGTRPKGVPIIPTDFAPASESIRLDGALVFAISIGHPSQCGSGSGPSGAVFAFATWFQTDIAWYLITFSTDPTVRQYSGPGTYVVRSSIYPYAPFGADPIFAGTLTLSIASDRSPASGSVRGTLDWVGAPPGSWSVTVSGNWSCVPGVGLGPG